MPQNMPVRDHNRADTDPASAPFWLSSGMSAKYIKLRLPKKKKNGFNFYNEKKLTVRVHQLLLRRNSDWMKITNAQLKGMFTHARAGGGGRKIGFNTNHHMCSHMRGRGVEAEREQNPLHKKWVQHPICRVRFETARSKPSLSSRNGRSARVRSAYVWTYLR